MTSYAAVQQFACHEYYLIDTMSYVRKKRGSDGPFGI
jgi:hypothetical protein